MPDRYVEELQLGLGFVAEPSGGGRETLLLLVKEAPAARFGILKNNDIIIIRYYLGLHNNNII
jgi:hypothetical protein